MNIRIVMAALLIGVTGLALPPAAHATEATEAPEAVTYEVISPQGGTADIAYFDGAVRRHLPNVPLPWRTTVMVSDPKSLGFEGAEVRADWTRSIAAPVWRPGHWVTVRVYIGDILRCENTLDVGNAACYGSTSFKSL